MQLKCYILITRPGKGASLRIVLYLVLLDEFAVRTPKQTLHLSWLDAQQNRVRMNMDMLSPLQSQKRYYSGSMWESEPALLSHSYKQGCVAERDAILQARNFHFCGN
jgi:hypothetical protein